MVSANLNWSKDSWKHVIEADAKGYYAYLPATFIYRDLNFGFFKKIEEKKYYNKNTYYDYRSQSNGKTITKYYCGTAIAQAPFFLAAHSYSKISGKTADGYSRVYMVWISISALFYVLVGLIFLNSTLKFYEKKELTNSLIFVACLFGTNLFNYTVSEPGMSHVFSIAFISAFCFYSKKYFLENNRKLLIGIAMLAGMIILIRPVNGLILLALPFLAGSLLSFRNGLRQAFVKPVYLILGSLAALGIISIQFVIYKISTGNYFIYAYGEEGFNFLEPHFFDILFSYKKGLFLYTPLYLISFLGLFVYWKRNKFEFFSFLGFFILLTFVLSSWWMWYYGGSFSSRVFVEYLPLFMMPLSVFIQAQSGLWKKLLSNSVIVLLIVICQIQTFQYRYYEIHWSDMTKEKYWNVFLRVDRLINKETNPVPPTN